MCLYSFLLLLGYDLYSKRGFHRSIHAYTRALNRKPWGIPSLYFDFLSFTQFVLLLKKDEMATDAQGSSSSAEKPTIVIVRGCFQTCLVYEALKKGLQDHGYDVVHPTLPSCSNTNSPEFPAVTLSDDALAVQREVTRLVHDDKTIIVVLHS